MNTEEAFERDILDHPFDDTHRLIYADWLEERGDERGEFLRLQHNLSRMAVGDKGYREGCAREKELLKKLDKVWVHRMRRYTTPPPCRDVAKLVPELAPFARTTIRLHPHPSLAPLGVAESKIGGYFLWPEAEDWPSCERHGIPLVPVIQLRNRDVPDIDFFGESDLFQLLWCPFMRDHNYQPDCSVFWRKQPDAVILRHQHPWLSGVSDNDEILHLIPQSCTIYPERVIEYPEWDDLDALVGESESKRITSPIASMDLGNRQDLRGRFSGPDPMRDGYSLYFNELSRCPGTKAGGELPFSSGNLYEHFLTLSSREFDSASFRRWVPLEDQRELAPLGESFAWEHLQNRASVYGLHEPTGMQIGRTQRLHLYVCRKGKRWPIHVQVCD